MNTLLIEPFAGMAGDMFLAALLDLEDPRFTRGLLGELAESLVPGECRLELSEVRRGSLRGLQLEVVTPESEHAPQRHYADLERLVRADGVPLEEPARERALAVLWRIATAEGRVHGLPPEEVHFHEVGAVDTLVDVCGAVLALERLEVTRVLASEPLVGSGTVTCAHGEMPVPTPAVVEIMRGLPMKLGGEGERLTPTGAALLAELTEPHGNIGSASCVGFKARAVGYGAGRRDPQVGPPNLLRVQLGEGAPVTGVARAEAWLLEVNLDDASGEELGWCVAGLRNAGALDVWTVPVQMKKDRPGCVLSALCREEQRLALEQVMFERTSTLGLRWSRVERRECRRRSFEVNVRGTSVRIKVRERAPESGGQARTEPALADLSPEYDDLVRLAEREGISLREAEWTALETARAAGIPGASTEGS